MDQEKIFLDIKDLLSSGRMGNRFRAFELFKKEFEYDMTPLDPHLHTDLIWVGMDFSILLTEEFMSQPKSKFSMFGPIQSDINWLQKRIIDMVVHADHIKQFFDKLFWFVAQILMTPIMLADLEKLAEQNSELYYNKLELVQEGSLGQMRKLQEDMNNVLVGTDVKNKYIQMVQMEIERFDDEMSKIKYKTPQEITEIMKTQQYESIKSYINFAQSMMTIED